MKTVRPLCSVKMMWRCSAIDQMRAAVRRVTTTSMKVVTKYASKAWRPGTIQIRTVDVS